MIRLFSRFRGPRRLYTDDWLIIFAWFLCVLSVGLWQGVSPQLYLLMDVFGGQQWPPPPSFDQIGKLVWQAQVIYIVFWLTSLFMVKLSFLCFFRRLRRNVTGGNYLWWAAFLFTASVYIVWIGTVHYKCLSIPLQTIIKECATQSESDIKFQVATLKAASALDIVTDFLRESSALSRFLIRCTDADSY